MKIHCKEENKEAKDSGKNTCKAYMTKDQYLGDQ